ncbi:hypothetical protein CLE01_25440 [Cryobacterium levicorallinum]|uniref:Cell division protein FtsB n=2 Tax=Cryobacterium levicorallinum TaxID=995038 RepID=A0ABY1EGT4_9MICO|nr:hypothetical protein CLE01_25440 [Cryobacterium levicorallinum]SFH79868.1 Cell division protein FtsB [Cryobacterium levicorallinum]
MAPKRPQQTPSQPQPAQTKSGKRPQAQRQTAHRQPVQREPAQRPPMVSETETPAGGWLRGIRFSGFSLVMMVILVLAVVILAPSLRTYAEQRQQISQLSRAVADQQDEVDRLTSQRERWNDRTYVTTQARERLFYVLPGDISFLVINDLPVVAPLEADAAPVSTNIQSTKIDWLGSLFASTMTAGLAPQAGAPATLTPATPETVAP